MTWDPVRNVAILFGGVVNNSMLGDTWRWNGTGWSQVPTGTGPPARMRHAMSFDPTTGRIVLFGGANGYSASNYLNDTWEWNGTQWQQVATAQSPPPLVGACMMHDPVQSRMLLVGQPATGPSSSSMEAWEYDGTTWTLLSTAAAYLPNQFHLALAWDQQRQRAVLFDSSTVRELTSVPADASLLGSGCGAPPPLLSGRTRPRTADSQFGLELLTRPNLPCLFALGFASGSTPIGNGCTLLLQQNAAGTFVLANGNGLAVQPIPLPPNQALRGFLVYAQGGALDPAAPGGLALSAALRMTVGD
jgi:hypothetical protein